MRKIPFCKMHGLGNCYIYINQFEVILKEGELSSLAKSMADLHLGIGSDGMILIGPSQRADIRMRIFNADGSEGKNCGNGLRCVARYVYDHGIVQQRNMTIETGGGMMKATLHVHGDAVEGVTVNLGKAHLKKKEIPMLGDPESYTIAEPFIFQVNGVPYTLPLTTVSLGSAHAVFIVDDVKAIPMSTWGPILERHPAFPDRVNVEFIQIIKPNEILFRVWERGTGITMACGTGATASVIAGILNDKVAKYEPVTVHLEGGDLQIEWTREDELLMTGPAEYICTGDFLI